MAGEFILETEGLTKEFKGFVAVNNVDLKVRRGHIHALIGPNGAGKTTFFNLLTKFLPPTRGTIMYQGADITHEKPAQTARRGIVRSFQISAVFPHMTVLENVRAALQRSLGTSFHFWKPERSLFHLHDRAQELLADGRPAGLRRRTDREPALRPQARAGAGHHHGAGARTDAAGRADAGHGPRGRAPRDGADQESIGRPHHPDGRAQHERGVVDRRPHHGAAARRHHRRRPLCRGFGQPAGDRSLHGHRRRRTCREPTDGCQGAPAHRRACTPGTANRTSCTAWTSR